MDSFSFSQDHGDTQNSQYEYNEFSQSQQSQNQSQSQQSQPLTQQHSQQTQDDDQDDSNYLQEHRHSNVRRDYFDAPDSMPDHACKYCGIHNKNSVSSLIFYSKVVKCISCSKWFCNSTGANGTAAHIISHMVKSRHKEVCLHADSALGDTVLECYNWFASIF